MGEFMEALVLTPVLEKKPDLSYEILDASFYEEFRTELNEKRFIELSRLAKKIGSREYYGDYHSQADYLDALELALSSTLETRHRAIFLWKKMLPLVAFKNNFLDVGIGDGKITRLISSVFQNVTVIDTSISALNVLPGLLRNKIKINKICDSVLNTSLQNNLYDFSLLSHVLYYIKPQYWIDIIEKLYHATKQGGLIVVAHSGNDSGKARLMKHFGGKTPNIDELFQWCRQRFSYDHVHGFCSDENFVAKGLTEMLHISGFMLYDAGASASREALTEYINKHFKRDDNSFCMTTRQKFIVIRKS